MASAMKVIARWRAAAQAARAQKKRQNAVEPPTAQSASVAIFSVPTEKMTVPEYAARFCRSFRQNDSHGRRGRKRRKVRGYARS